MRGFCQRNVNFASFFPFDLNETSCGREYTTYRNKFLDLVMSFATFLLGICHKMNDIFSSIFFFCWLYVEAACLQHWQNRNFQWYYLSQYTHCCANNGAALFCFCRLLSHNHLIWHFLYHGHKLSKVHDYTFYVIFFLFLLSLGTDSLTSAGIVLIKTRQCSAIFYIIHEIWCNGKVV